MTLVLETQNKADYQLFIELAKRLQIAYREEPQSLEELASTEDDFFALAGSWQSDQSTDELIHLIESTRTTKTDDLRL
ncbi:hypothetical protein GCM10028805_07720 [Spirosoma harenae]